MKHSAKVIHDNKEEIMDLWIEEVREKVLASQYANDIILVDHLPKLLQLLEELLNRHDSLEKAEGDGEYERFLQNSADHGRHRATAQGYSVDQIIHEYFIFHRITTDQLIAHRAYDPQIADLLKHVVEKAMLESAAAFSLSIQEMQEKLVGTLAHDIRNPLTTTLLVLDLMAETEDQEEIAKLREMARRGIQKAIVLTEGLLDTITVKAGEGISLDFAKDDIVHHAERVYLEVSQVHAHELKFISDKDQIRGVFDGTAIHRVLENLVTNAIKYGSPADPITIKVEDEGDNVKLSVHNHGNPIPKDRQEDIFDFMSGADKRNKTKLQSWGIGLTLVKLVAEAHAGGVELISNEEHGTSFIVTINKTANEPGKKRTKLNYSE